jgi:hypothetical protein
VELPEERTQPPGGLWQAWVRFWFKPADPTLLGLIRICCGLVTLYVHAAYTVDLYEFFGANAWVDMPVVQEFRHDFAWMKRPGNDWNEQVPYERPDGPDEAKVRQDAEYMLRFIPPADQLRNRELVEQGILYGPNPKQTFRGYKAWSIWYHITDPTWMMVVHVGILVTMFLFTIGFCTRITSVLTWMAALSYIQRSPITLFGQDTMMNILLLYLMIGPSGAALSVDRLIKRYWITWRALRAHRPVPVIGPAAPRVTANLALRLIQVNLLWIYFMAGMSKLQGNLWWTGTATWLTWMNWEFSPFGLSLFGWRPWLDSMTLLASYRPVWEAVLTGSVAFTFFVELGFPFLVWWPRMRGFMMTCAFIMHLGIGCSMGLWTFSLMMMCMVLAFLPQATLHGMLDFLFAGQDGLQLRFNGRDRGQARWVSLISAFDVWHQIRYHEVSPPRAPRGPLAAASSTAVQAARVGRADEPAPEHLELATESGEHLTGYSLLERLVRSLRLLWPVALWTFVPGVPPLGRVWLHGAGAE